MESLYVKAWVFMITFFVAASMTVVAIWSSNEINIKQARIEEITTDYRAYIDELEKQKLQMNFDCNENMTQLNSNISNLETIITQKDNNISNLSILRESLMLEYTLYKDTTQSKINDYNNLSAELNATKDLVLYNPTYAEMAVFLDTDLTDEHEYNNTEYGNNYYVCKQFARDVKYNASLQNIKCAYVLLTLKNDTTNETSSHAINAFDTTDKGLYFVESKTDQLTTGLAFNTTYEYMYNERILDITIIW